MGTISAGAGKAGGAGRAGDAGRAGGAGKGKRGEGEEAQALGEWEMEWEGQEVQEGGREEEGQEGQDVQEGQVQLTQQRHMQRGRPRCRV